MKIITCTVAIVIAITGTLYALDNDRHYEQEATKSYCEQVDIWQSDKAAGIPPSKRKGWAPYNKYINCEGN